MSGKGVIVPPGGAVTYEKHHASDWLPTLVSMAAGEDWTKHIPKDEPPYQLGDGVNNWPMLSSGGKPGSSARDWLLYETHPADDKGREHGDALVVGDMKIIKWGQTMPQDENGWYPPPGQDANSTTYLLPCKDEATGKPRQGDAPDSKQCHDDWCLFNVTAVSE